MTKNHTPESVQQAIFLTLSQIQNVIYDFWNAEMPWSQAHKELQRHALELRLLDRPDLPQTVDPLRYVRTSARAIERANAARDRIKADVQTSRFGTDQPAAGGISEVQTTGGPDDSASGPDDVQDGPDPRPEEPRSLVQTIEERMTYGDESLEEGSADVDTAARFPLQVGALPYGPESYKCILCRKEMGPGSRARYAGAGLDDGEPRVICLDCWGDEPPRAVP
jgi:hypothetical protein